jgi:hypothetical protein
MMILSQYHIFELDTINIYSAVPLTVGKVVGGTSYNNSKESKVFFLILVPLLILMLLYDRGSAFIANM